MSFSELLERTDDLYRNRGRLNSVEHSIELLKGAQSESGADLYEVYWRLSRAFFFLGQEAGSRSPKVAYHREGVASGERAAETRRERVEGHFWLGVNLALLAEASGGIGGAIALLRARRALGRAAVICESYHGAGPLRVLGRLAHKAPRMLGGSLHRAKRLYARALDIASGNTVTMLYAAELALRLGESERAGRLLRGVLESSGAPDWEFEALRDKECARALLERLQ